MAIELRQQLRLSQQLIMTPQLQMAIKLLQLNRLELQDMINQELEENPALEEIQETPEEHTLEQTEVKADTTSSTKEVTIDEKFGDDVDWSNYFDEYASPGKTHFESEKKEALNFETFTANKESLDGHLLWQLLMTSPTKEEEKIGSLVIGNLDKNGYLDASVDEIAQESGSSPEKVTHLLSLMHKFDPPGICARNLSESLLIQAKQLGLDDTIVTQIITNHIKNLENKNYKAICNDLKISIKEVISAVNIIKGLEPKPGRKFGNEESLYIIPDIFVYKKGDDFIIVLNNDGMPRLHINSYYQNAITHGKEISGQTKEYLRDKMRSAAWLIKSIHQRQKTIYKVMESIIKFQTEFFEKGIAYLKPMVLRDVAQDIDMHESTISRVTTNKYAYTPQGIFELKYFFNSSINRIHGDAIASASVQEKIKQIIESENSRKPYSDDKITTILKESNINIARRTVAKYREMMRILSSSKRKQY